MAAFPGTTREAHVLEHLLPTYHASICEFLPPEATEADPHPEGGGWDALNVFRRVEYETRGKEHNLAIGQHWPAMTTKAAYNAGPKSYIRAYVGYSFGGEGPEYEYGVLQVRNDVFIVDVGVPKAGNDVDVDALLGQVARELL